jgi:hypothetical protein
MTKNVEVWQLVPGDTVTVKGDSMVVKNIDAEFAGINLNLIDSHGRGHYQAYGLDDIIPLELSD